MIHLRYLTSLPLQEAIEKFFDYLGRFGGRTLAAPVSEEIEVRGAGGRITAGPVFAARSCPHYQASAVDGVALRAADTFGATETSPVELRLGLQAAVVDTGDPIPSGFDAVVMIEDVDLKGDGSKDGLAVLVAPAVPWQHIRPVGEDIVASDLIFTSGHRLGPADLAALLAAGLTRVKVRLRPRVGIIPTGSEIVPAGSSPAPGEIPESNSAALAELVRDWGGEPEVLPIVPDDRSELAGAFIQAAAGFDIIVANAGSSAGRDDYTASILTEHGSLIVHGVAIRPGKPVILGELSGKPFVGLPGYPVSTILTAELFLRPLICRFLGIPEPVRARARAVLARSVTSPSGVEEFLRVKLALAGGKLVAVPMGRGAGAITGLIRADGLVRIPVGVEAWPEGTEVEAELLRPMVEIESAVLCAGSHDLLLDLLADEIRGVAGSWSGRGASGGPGVSLNSAHVGSLAGIMAVKRSEAHLAGIHLLDPATGVYNETYIRRYLPGRKFVLFHLARRVQGLMVRPGNPAGIRSLEDLARPGVSFVNRQKGSGTRVLLDYHLSRLGIDPSRIYGYDRVVYTHTTVAAEVVAEGADAGLGLLAAAQAFGLEFIPVADENYDLLIPAESYDLPGIRAVLEAARSPAWQARAARFGGYDLAETGTEKWIE